MIGGTNFGYPHGTGCNVLCFFISGLPGGLDYLLLAGATHQPQQWEPRRQITPSAALAGVKAGRVAPFTEKRLNCSINTCAPTAQSRRLGKRLARTPPLPSLVPLAGGCAAQASPPSARCASRAGRARTQARRPRT